MGAIGSPYITVEQLELRLGRPDDGTFAAIVGAASRAIELFTGRQFNRAEAATPRRFRAVDCQRLTLDDFWTVEDLAVSVDGTVWDVADVDPRPWDGIVAGQLGWPFFDLFTVGRSWPTGAQARRAVVSVTARWGWAEVPDPIGLAVLDVAEDVAFGSAGGPKSSETLGDYSVSFASPAVDPADLIGLVSGNPRAFLRAAPYVRRSPAGVA
jgi:hypothetical protein